MDSVILILKITLVTKMLMAVFIGLATGFAADFIQKHAPGYVKGETKNRITAILSGFAAFLIGISDIPELKIVQGILLILLCVFASRCDISERKVANWVSFCIFSVGFAGLSITEFRFNLVCAIAIFMFLLLCAVISGNRIGGADIKFTAAFFFVLGLKGIPGLIAGFLFAIIGTVIRNHTDKGRLLTGNNRKTMPMIPYLSAGFISMLII